VRVRGGAGRPGPAGGGQHLGPQYARRAFPRGRSPLGARDRVDPGAVELEVTENTIGLDRATAQSVLARLRSSGLVHLDRRLRDGLFVDGASYAIYPWTASRSTGVL